MSLVDYMRLNQKEGKSLKVRLMSINPLIALNRPINHDQECLELVVLGLVKAGLERCRLEKTLL